MQSDIPQIWFSEPTMPDDTFMRRDENNLDWLKRSTSKLAKGCRRFLNENISKLPLQNQDSFARDLRLPKKWQSTFFELINARILQELGASITIESPNSDGKCPDFKAHFPDATVIVEAKSPIFNGEVGEELKRRIPLLNYIESKTPTGWSVAVWQVPNIERIGKQFKCAVDRMLDVPPPHQNEADKELIEEVDNGIIHLHLFSASLDNNRIAIEAPISLVDNSQNRIKHAIKRKRKQVRNSQAPVLLAIQASGICSDFEDFDLALFGGDCAHVDRNHRIVKTTFLPSGIFNNKRDEAPTYAGVLAFLNVDFNFCVGPILYHHPRFTGVLPEALLQFEQRRYNKNLNCIETVPAKLSNLHEILSLVKV